MNSNARQSDSLPAPGADALAQSEALTGLIRERIAAAGGWLPFDRYMDLVLYAPGLGYYSGGAMKFGRRGEDGSDFVTAPELSPLFATTLARPVAQALQQSGTRQLMEFGAGTGKLAAGLMSALAQLDVPFDSYAIVDLSGELRARQRETIERDAPALAAKVQWLDSLPDSFEGVVIGNEVLDAMPVRLVARKLGAWHERGVVLLDDRLAFDDRPITPDAQVELIDAAIDDANDEPFAEYVTETHEAALGFTKTVCTMLVRGAAFFIDYGFPRREFYHAQRAGGTLMCHYRHRAHPDPFLYPGLQDITAHVEFTGIAEAGVETGADLLGFTSQARFLLNAGVTDVLGELDPSDVRRFLPAANAVQKLLSEAEMGELFKVIAFSRGISGTLDAFATGDRTHTL
ncbi:MULTISPECIES: class I SAM-dependent methyltransferase [unclassified Caballeronia]|uniref:class I SAM-dependent methyltransferase n=1 Tax=unclassified Caballeronia TaxID=2646786 RepID=UPI0028560682|nr:MULTISPECIES: class I SAM-dependent methyltransferase [unclassified Caballeronia]MDR5821257.1 class I SAM-dependent methyltransferase [Caballeronia sp. LZ043]MDR5879433.1 class I SAM-dependent methyltransferase [Caballeronia sp. LZ032]